MWLKSTSHWVYLFFWYTRKKFIELNLKYHIGYDRRLSPWDGCGLSHMHMVVCGLLCCCQCLWWLRVHDDVIKWKHFPRYWPFVRGIHRSPVNSLHRGQWRGALMFSLISAWINGWVNDREARGLRRHRAHHDVIVMTIQPFLKVNFIGIGSNHTIVLRPVTFLK